MGIKKSVPIYCADFETTTIETSDTETWVWAWGVRELYKKNSFTWGKTIDEFFEWCVKGSNKLVYFHNLRFDGHSILDYLLRHDYKDVTELNGKPKEKTFTTIVTEENQFYSIEVCFSVKNNRAKKVTFHDSLKKIPAKVEGMARSYDIEFKKGDIDYKKVRPKGYEPTAEEIDYLFRDVEIVAQVVEAQYNNGLTGMTIGSDSLATFKEMMGGDKAFERIFPKLSNDDNKAIRKSYRGGYTYLLPHRARKIIRNGIVLDVNSLYPAMMLKPMPYGDPVKFEGEYVPNSVYNLYIVTFVCEFELKDRHLPTIQIKDDLRFKKTEYVTSTKGDTVELTLTSVDLQLFLEHYDVFIYEWKGGYMFKQIQGIFSDFIEKFMKIKRVETGAKKEISKLLLNNLYGKFATSTDGVLRSASIDKETNTVKLTADIPREKKSIYTPVGCFITAYARETTIRSAQANYDRIIYMDTDSMHLEGEEIPEGLHVHQSDLGAWKFEYSFTQGVFLRAKTYLEQACQKYDHKKESWVYCTTDEMERTKKKVVCAGMPDNVKEQVTFDNFREGSRFFGKLMPKVLPGGMVLVDGYFTIKSSNDIMVTSGSHV